MFNQSIKVELASNTRESYIGATRLFSPATRDTVLQIFIAVQACIPVTRALNEKLDSFKLACLHPPFFSWFIKNEDLFR